MLEPIRLEVPQEILTDRLLLRCPRFGDGETLFKTVHASLAHLKPWMPWATDHYDIQTAEDWCRRAAAIYLSRERFNFLILHKDTGHHMGNIMTMVRNWKVPRFEIGYWLGSSYIGHGYMTEAVVALTQFNFQILMGHRSEILCDVNNAPSQKVAERAGYLLEGICKNERLDLAGNLCDMKIYAATR